MTQRDEGQDDNQTAAEIRHMSVLLEQVISKNQAILESMDTVIAEKVRPVVREELDTRLQPMEADIKLIKAAVTETNRDLRKIDVRVTRLETVSHAHA